MLRMHAPTASSTRRAVETGGVPVEAEYCCGGLREADVVLVTGLGRARPRAVLVVGRGQSTLRWPLASGSPSRVVFGDRVAQALEAGADGSGDADDGARRLVLGRVAYREAPAWLPRPARHHGLVYGFLSRAHSTPPLLPTPGVLCQAARVSNVKAGDEAARWLDRLASPAWLRVKGSTLALPPGGGA